MTLKCTTVLQATVFGLFLTMSPAVFATTLSDALIQAYQTNPALRVGRAGLRATDETVRQAKAAREPSVSGNIAATRIESPNPRIDTTPNTSASITASVPLYAGGTLILGVEQARLNVLSTRQSLITTEQTVLFDAVTAFMDVRRDQRNVQLARNSVKVLNEEVRAARERFEVGEVTRTDVAQAESRLAASESGLQTNIAALQRAIDFYIATVGSKPTNLRIPPVTPKLPSSANAAEAIAIARHPSILQQQFAVKAAEKSVAISKGNKSAVISANAAVSRSNNNSTTFGGGVDKQTQGQIGLNLDQTIYNGGRLNSLERQALAQLSQQKANLQLAGVQVRQNVHSIYATWTASKATIIAGRKQVRAAKIAFDGASEEAKLGARTTLDVLNSEQDLLQAQSDLVSAIRDEYVNAYGVLSAMGLLTVDHLGLGIESYDPDLNYKKVNGLNKFGQKRLKIFDKIMKLGGN